MTFRFRSTAVLAALAVVALPACAQFDYTVYGVADLSYGRFEPSGQIREHRFNSNSLTATFGGLGASYGFENGWTAGMTLESFFRFQDMKLGRNDNDPTVSRNAFVSLSNRDVGTFRAGRLQTLLFNTTTRFNALGNSVGFSPAVRHVFAAGNLLGVQGDFYWNQAVGYTTPSLEGIAGNVIAARGESARPGTLVGGSVVLSRGVLAGTVSAQKVSIDDGINDPVKETAVQLGVNYNFGWANLFGLYTRTQDTGLDVDSDLFSAGAAVPLGPGTVVAQLASSKADGPAVNRKQTTFSAGYIYAFDSQTDLYVIAMDDRVRGQTRGVSAAFGVRYRFGQAR